MVSAQDAPVCEHGSVWLGSAPLTSLAASTMIASGEARVAAPVEGRARQATASKANAAAAADSAAAPATARCSRGARGARAGAITPGSQSLSRGSWSGRNSLLSARMADERSSCSERLSGGSASLGP
ncbi:unnamed protein product [Prorocentrum cordatum]|uniref:Uncharacterized protein n=1 Tax=Prorocentrum cordatum TaxID=2364126 RepID=A0ABN9RDJ6_9DINO|nr:unnamed protein product [Polarella glacialis]